MLGKDKLTFSPQKAPTKELRQNYNFINNKFGIQKGNFLVMTKELLNQV